MSFIYLGIILILLGIIIKQFKLYFLIAGYNTMAKEEKAKVKIEKVAVLLRNVLVFLGLSMVLIGMVAPYFQNPKQINYLFFGIVIVSMVFLLVKSNSAAYKN